MSSSSTTHQEFHARRHRVRGWASAIAGYRGLPAILIGLTALLAMWRLDSSPPVWWDEGWTLSVARNWVTLGHYGRLLDGEWINSTLAAAFPVTAPVALSFWLFGVGAWQARIVGVVFLIGALAAIYFLASQIYNRKVALGALVLLGFVFPGASIFPAHMARQVLGEVPMMFYLLAGYAFFLRALNHPRWLPLAALFWGLGLAAKQQAFPFWAASMLLPLLAVVLKRHLRTAAVLGIGFAGALGVWQAHRWLTRSFLTGFQLPGSGGSISGLEGVTALVLTVSTQLAALKVVLTFGLPIVLGLAYAAFKWFEAYRQATRLEPRTVVQLQLLSLAGSWAAWFLVFSVGWHRYFFPIAFVGCVFVSALLHDLTQGFSASAMLREGRALWREARASLLSLRSSHTPRLLRRSLRWLAALGLSAVLLGLGVRTLARFVKEPSDVSLTQVIHFLNTATAPDARIETYDSELFFLLDRSYHHPPDQVHVELIRRAFVDPQAEVDYDPLAAKPDYLVVGAFSRSTELYDPVLATGAFRPVYSDGLYEVFERVR